MPKPYDATTKDLLETDPGAWLALVGRPAAAPVRLIEADLATVTAEADKVMLVEEADPWLAHVELQSSRDPGLVRRLLRYNVLMTGRHGHPAWSAVVLLRPEADDPALSGQFRERLPDGRTYLEFSYGVVRLWREPVAPILEGRLGTLPLAPLSAVTRRSLPGVVRRMEERLTDAEPEVRAKL